MCVERIAGANFLFTKPEGAYCKNILKGTWVSTSSTSRNFTL